MISVRIALLLALGTGAGSAAGFWYAQRTLPVHVNARIADPVVSTNRDVLYYRDPTGAPFWSADPKKDQQGREYVPVHDDEEPSFEPAKPKPDLSKGSRKILYYRNPMGLPDTSPVPKKDSMGMDYIPVYDGEEGDDSTVKVSLDKVQRSGVRTEIVETRRLIQPIRAVGTVKFDERRQTVVTVRADGYIEDLFINATGQAVTVGEPLFRLYSRDIQLAQADLIVATGMGASNTSALMQSIQGTVQRLRNLGVPESRIEEVRRNKTNPRTLDWPSPATGTVMEKRIINGQQVTAGAELYRIADLSHVWVIAEVAEADLAGVVVGMPAAVMLRAYSNDPLQGSVTFIYPDIKPETRTARVRIELPNPDGRIKIDMYADVVFGAGDDSAPVTAVPDSAIIDSGNRRVVLIARDEGRFEPRAVKVGRRADGYVEIRDGVQPGEKVVTSATFLIDAESNLRAALKSFARSEPSE